MQNEEIELHGLKYKIGLRGKVYIKPVDDWVLSTTTPEELQAMVDANERKIAFAIARNKRKWEKTVKERAK